LRRSELILLAAFVTALVVAAVAGLRRGAGEMDARLSTDVSGPWGAKGLALSLERLGLRVERWREPLYDVDSVLAGSEPRVRLALLDVTVLPSVPERRALARYVDGGGDLFVVGISGMEECLGIELQPVGEPWESETSTVAPPVGIGELPRARWTVTIDPDSGVTEGESRRTYDRSRDECGLVRTESEVLLQTRDSVPVPVLVRLRYAGGGLVTVLADNGFLSNRALKETDVGALLIPVLLAGRPDVVVVDEYHHDPGAGGSLWLAAGGWLFSNPVGWAVVQLALGALLALALAAVRFGPALRVVERRRRSPQEHVEALAAGLERSNEARTAISLIVGGLRRRLSTGSVAAPSSLNVDAWLAALGNRAMPKARADISRLRELLLVGESDRDVVDAARTAEILWKRLGR
jgi:hypothetical protein